MLTLLVAASLLLAQDPPDDGDLVELRGVVLSPADDAALANRAAVAQTLDYLYDSGANVVFPIAWRATGTLWLSVVAEKACGFDIDPQFVDPKFKTRNVLTEIVVEAHRNGIEAVPIIDLVSFCPPKDPKDKSAPAGPLDPKAQAFALELIGELVHIHEIDGIAFDAHGMASVPTLAEKDVVALGDWLATVRAAVAKIDPGVRLVLIDGGAAQAAWMERGLFDVAVPRIAARDGEAWKKSVDALVAQEWAAKDRSRVVPMLVTEDGGWRAGYELVLAAIAHSRAAKVKGEILTSFATLKADENKLADELQAGPWYGVAQVPWRKGVAWREHTDAIPPKAGEGRWEWRTDSSGVAVLELGGNQKGDASWTLHSLEKGNYDLFVWIAPDADVGKKVIYTTSFSGIGTPPRVVDPTLPRNKGWVYMATVPMGRRETREVLRLLGDETDATKVTSAGPMVAILSRRPRAR